MISSRLAKGFVSGSQADQGLVSAPGFLLAHQELNTHDGVGNHQEDNRKIEGNIAGCYGVEKLASHILKIAFIFDTYFVQLLVQTGIGSHKAISFHSLLTEYRIHIRIIHSLGMIEEGFIRKNQCKGQSNRTIRNQIYRLNLSSKINRTANQFRFRLSSKYAVQHCGAIYSSKVGTYINSGFILT